MSEVVSSFQNAISTGCNEYPKLPPYSPGVLYPEYPFNPQTLINGVNHAYNGVRDALRLLQLDVENYGKKDWNPLGEIIHSGDLVVLKPNFVRDFRETQSGDENCLITHGSIIRAALDFVYIAIKGQGRIVIADAPQNDADFDEIRRLAGLDKIQKFYQEQAGFEVEIYDLRPERARKINGVIVGHDKLSGDPAGYVKVNLGNNSMFTEVENLCHLLYGSEYDTREIRSHHTGGVHEYLISKTVLDADCVINLPKLKTHKKTGMTVCMKNMVGINGNKNWLPHYREGTPAQGGDQFADNSIKHRIERKAMFCFRYLFPLFGSARAIMAKPLKAIGKGIFGDTNMETIRSGNWYGNDTTWRMVIDLNRILMYADKDGHIGYNSARSVFCIVDGIVGGQGNGPLDPGPKPAGIVVAGSNLIAVDLTCARLMDFDYKRLPLLYRSLEDETLPLFTGRYCDVICKSNNQRFDRALCEFRGINLDFIPHFGWQNHIELRK